ncbi:MAG: glutamate--tRNA ligase family protein, partial [Candidatus Woesearchaeota archaeon]
KKRRELEKEEINSKKENINRWEKMLEKTGYSQGDAVVRFKSNMKHKNPAMRDFPLARICTTPHPKQGVKYRVWPLMNLSVTIDDIESGMTHIIRAKDHQTNSKRQKLIYDALDVSEEFPEVYFTGKLKFDDLDLSTSKTKKLLKEGKFNGWDDIRLPFLKSLKKRGYKPEAFHELIKEFGLSNVDKVFSKESFFKTLNTFNRKIVDPKANRFVFLEEPEDIIINDVPPKKIELDLHPDFSNGKKKFSLRDSYYLSKEDLDYIEENEGKLFRYKDVFNFYFEDEEFKFHSFDFETYKESKNREKVIQMIPKHLGAKTKIYKPSNEGWEIEEVRGYSESGVIDYVSDVVRFEKFGFCRFVEKAHHELVFYYTHD